MRSIHSLQASSAETSFMPLAAEDSRVGWRPATGSQVIYFVTIFIVFIQCLFECFTYICCPRPEVMGQVQFFLKALNFKGRKKSKKDPCALRSEGPLTCKRKAGFSFSGTPPARKPTPLWSLFPFVTQLEVPLLAQCLWATAFKTTGYQDATQPPTGPESPCRIWRGCQNQEQLPSVSCWNTLSSTAQHDTGHPNWPNRKVLQGNATSATPPAKPDRLESQEMLSSRTLGDLNLALFPWVLWFPHHVMRGVS